MAKTDDTKLIRRVVGGDTEAFALLLERYEAKVYGLVARLVSDSEEAADVAQETFVQAFLHLNDYRGEADFGSWLYRIAYNAALMHLRRNHITTITIDDRLTECVSDDDTDKALAEVTEERISQLEKALTRLSPDDRTAITLFYLEERSTRDIAYVLGTSVSNITTRLHRARKRLYLLMKQ